ncbi:MAG: hypothetical protein MI919_13520, partial [Holophagales bacterium]|nr:hypothetical protein [Holophagales bacterium]
VVDTALLSLVKEFTDDPVAPGATANLRFSLFNLSATRSITGVAFTDDLNAALSGLSASGPPFAACGGTVTPGGGTLSFSGGSLAPAEVCPFDVPVVVPAGAAAGVYTNTTSTLSGSSNLVPVDGPAATDTLEVIQLLDFSKSFDGPTTAGGTAILTFTLTNPGTTTAAGIAFNDDLDAVLTGLMASTLPATPCGAGSSIAGTSLLTLTGGELAPLGGTCTFDVEVSVPGTAAPGTYPNVSSPLFRQGLAVSIPATADLVIEPPPVFTKVFAPDSIPQGGLSTLTFTIDNSASALAATAFTFTDDLPTNVVIANTPNGSTTCTAGMGDVVGGASSFTFDGGEV